MYINGMDISRYDIVEGHYWFYTDWHSGQWSREYERLCKITRYFRPGAGHNGPTSYESQHVYDQLVEKHMRKEKLGG